LPLRLARLQGVSLVVAISRRDALPFVGFMPLAIRWTAHLHRGKATDVPPVHDACVEDAAPQ
jgi:hypothetical protein